MKILLIRAYLKAQGTTKKLADAAAAALRDMGCEIDEINLQGLRIHDCVHCDLCQRTGFCAINDDMTDLYDRLEEADALVLASPIYFCSLTAIARLFFDRLYACGQTLAGKKLALIATAGDGPFEGLDIAVQGLQKSAQYLHMPMTEPFFRAPADSAAMEETSLAQDARAFAQSLNA